MLDGHGGNIYEVVLISISKIFCIPGLRVGFVVSYPETIRKFRRYLPPWSVNSLAQAVGRYLALQGTEVNLFIKKTICLLKRFNPCCKSQKPEVNRQEKGNRLAADGFFAHGVINRRSSLRIRDDL
jgi:histidinol-phosphate/aromatic aminotransferase/cobyric acid decarboxylase-like protein